MIQSALCVCFVTNTTTRSLIYAWLRPYCQFYFNILHIWFLHSFFDTHLHSSCSASQSHLVLALLLLFLTPSTFFQCISVLINPKHSISFHLSQAVVSVRQLSTVRVPMTMLIMWCGIISWGGHARWGMHLPNNTKKMSFLTLILGHIYPQ